MIKKVKVLEPEEYVKYLRDYCQLTEQETNIILNKAIKRFDKEQILNKNKKY